MKDTFSLFKTLLFFFLFIAPIHISTYIIKLTTVTFNAEFFHVLEIVLRTALLIYVWKLANNPDFPSFLWTKKFWKSSNFHLLILPIFVIGSALFLTTDEYSEYSLKQMFFLFSLTFLIGFTEEVYFRGVVFPFFIEKFKGLKLGVFKSVIISSLLFGLAHYFNLIKEPGNFWGITTQVIFAFAIGFLFCGLLLRTGNIIPIAIIHMFINFTFGHSLVLEKRLNGNESFNQGLAFADFISLNALIPLLALSFILIISGFFMIKNAKNLS